MNKLWNNDHLKPLVKAVNGCKEDDALWMIDQNEVIKELKSQHKIELFHAALLKNMKGLADRLIKKFDENYAVTVPVSFQLGQDQSDPYFFSYIDGMSQRVPMIVVALKAKNLDMVKALWEATPKKNLSQYWLYAIVKENVLRDKNCTEWLIKNTPLKNLTEVLVALIQYGSVNEVLTLFDGLTLENKQACASDLIVPLCSISQDHPQKSMNMLLLEEVLTYCEELKPTKSLIHSWVDVVEFVSEKSVPWKVLMSDLDVTGSKNKKNYLHPREACLMWGNASAFQLLEKFPVTSKEVVAIVKRYQELEGFMTTNCWGKAASWLSLMKMNWNKKTPEEMLKFSQQEIRYYQGWSLSFVVDWMGAYSNFLKMNELMELRNQSEFKKEKREKNKVKPVEKEVSVPIKTRVMRL